MPLNYLNNGQNWNDIIPVINTLIAQINDFTSAVGGTLVNGRIDYHALANLPEPSDGNTLNLGKPASGYYSLPAAVAAVPDDKRRPGLCITYMVAQGTWRIKQFTADDISRWNDTDYWNDTSPVISSVSLTLLNPGDTPTAAISDGNLSLGIPRAADGANAVNPFKGWYPDTAAIADVAGATGAFLYVKGNDPSDPVTVYTFDDSTAQWAPTTETFNPANDQSFATSQQVSDVKIDPSNLRNPTTDDDLNHPVLAKASDVMQLKAKLQGVTREETPVSPTPASGYVSKDTGEPANTAGSSQYVEVALGGASAVRFRGAKVKSTGFSSGYAFGHYEETGGVATWVRDGGGGWEEDTTMADHTTKDYMVPVPAGATHFRTTCKLVTGGVTILGGADAPFYCYLQTGAGVTDLIPAVADDLATDDPAKALSARQGMALNERVEAVRNVLNPYEELAYGTAERFDKWYIYSLTEGWHYSGSSYVGCWIVPVTPGDEIKVLKTGENSSALCFLKSDPREATLTVGDMPDVSDVDGGLKSVNSATQGSERVLVVPSDASYMYVLGRTNSTASAQVRRPDAIYRRTPMTQEDNPVVDLQGRVAALEGAADGEWLSKAVREGLYEVEEYSDAEDYVTLLGHIGKDASTFSTPSYSTYKHVVVFVGDAEMVELEMPTATRVSFTSSNSYYPGKSVYLVEDGQVWVEADTKQTLAVPDGAGFMKINLNADTLTEGNAPKYVRVYRKKETAEGNDVALWPAGMHYSAGSIGLFSNRYSRLFRAYPDRVYRVSLMSGNNAGAIRREKLFETGAETEYTLIRQTTNTPMTFVVKDFDGYVQVTANSVGTLTVTARTKRDVEEDERNAALEGLAGMVGFEEVALAARNGSVATATSAYGGYVYRASASYRSAVVALHGERFLKVVANDSDGATFYFLTEAPTSADNEKVPAFAETYRLSHTVAAGKSAVCAIPQEANYVLFNLGASESLTPAYVGLVTDSTNVAASSMSDYRDQIPAAKAAVAQASQTIGQLPATYNIPNRGTQPATVQQKHIIDRCNRMIGSAGPHITGTTGNLVWTPRHTVPGKGHTSNAPRNYDAGVPVNWGVPYSSNVGDYKEVGIHTSIYTFMTAVDNPYSVMYTEKVTKNASRSAWGRVYANTNGFAYYGTVCCGLSSYAVGSPIKYGNTTHIRYADLYGIFVPLANKGEVNWDFMQVGDIFDDNKHSFVIYDITRAADGSVTRVLTAESTGSAGSNNGHIVGGCLHRQFTKAAFLRRMVEHSVTDPYIHYRFAELYKLKGLSDDDAQDFSQLAYNNAISTIYGDKASLTKGDLVVLNYNLYGTQAHDWDGIVVQKRGLVEYEPLSACPENWAEDWVDYYKIEDGNYVKLFIDDGDEVAGEAPAFEEGTYYRKLDAPTVGWADVGTYTLAEAEQSLVDFYAEVTPNPFNSGIDQSGHALVLGYGLDAGMYRAFMTDGEHNSDPVMWEILPADFDIVRNGDGSYTITNNTDYEMVYVTACDPVPGDYKATAVSYVGRPVSFYENRKKELRLYVDEMKTLYGVVTNQCTHVRIMLRGEYAITASLPIELPRE